MSERNPYPAVSREGKEDALDYVGFKRHRLGRIHLFCPGCGRKVSNVQRAKWDPPAAVLAHLPCERCSAGCKVEGASCYLDANGKTVEWWRDAGRMDTCGGVVDTCDGCADCEGSK